MMPPSFNFSDLDAEWANSLIGLRMIVPENWFVSGSGHAMNRGRISRIDTETENSAFFILNLDSYPGDFPMRYDAVFLYSDERSESFSEYLLPSELVVPPGSDRVFVPPPARDTSEEEDDISCSSEDGEPQNVYSMTDPSEWKFAGKNGRGRPVEPVPFCGDGEEFAQNITDQELESLKNEMGEICYWKVYEWMLPIIDGISFFDWLAARMRNYMTHLIKDAGYKCRYFNPEDGKVITGDNVCHFFGCHIARMLHGFPSIDDTWSTRDILDAVGPCKEAMPQGAYMDMYRCMHFVDDWEEEDGEWERFYEDTKWEGGGER